MSDETEAAGHASGNADAASELETDTVAQADAALARAANAPVPLRLRVAREALGLSLLEVAARTRITSRYVEAIEAGDYASLPGRPYALGFARGYARVVGLDENEIAEAVRRELEAGTTRPEPRVFQQFEVDDPAKTPSKIVSWLALALALGIVAMGMVLWKSYYWPSAELPSLVALESQVPAPKASATQTAPQALDAARPAGPVVFTALESGVWVKFYDAAGTQLLQKQLGQGEAYTVPVTAQGPKLWTGRPDALAITIGGQAIPRLAEEQKIMKDVPIDAASLRARSAPMNAGPAAAVPSPAKGKAPRFPPAQRIRPRKRISGPPSSLDEPSVPLVSATSSTAAN